jgi:hypothetical protein
MTVKKDNAIIALSYPGSKGKITHITPKPVRRRAQKQIAEYPYYCIPQDI